MHCQYNLYDGGLLHFVYMRSWQHFGYPSSRLIVSFQVFCTTWSTQFAIGVGRGGCQWMQRFNTSLLVSLAGIDINPSRDTFITEDGTFLAWEILLKVLQNPRKWIALMTTLIVDRVTLLRNKTAASSHGAQPKRPFQVPSWLQPVWIVKVEWMSSLWGW
jgi:hypothetical protein